MAFFSGTDFGEVHDNAGSFEYYLSLIVNNDGKYCAKVAFEGTVNRGFKLKNPGDTGEFEDTVREMLVLVDMEIVKESREVLPTDIFQERYEVVRKDKEERKKYTTTYNSGSYSGYTNPYRGLGQQDMFQDVWGEGEEFEDWKKDQIKKDKEKKITGSTKDYPYRGKSGQIVSLSDYKFNEFLMNWFTMGLEAFEGLHFNQIPEDLNDAIKIFDDYFDGEDDTTDQFDYYINYMTKIMPVVFEDINPYLVRTKGMKAMVEWFELYDICQDLEAVFDAYPTYLEELKHLKESLNGE